MEETGRKREKLYVTFHLKEDIVRFVDVCCEYDDAIDIVLGKMRMDAKSVLGMMLMKTEEPLEIEYSCFDEVNSYVQFRTEIMQKFDVRAESVESEKPSCVDGL